MVRGRESFHVFLVLVVFFPLFSFFGSFCIGSFQVEYNERITCDLFGYHGAKIFSHGREGGVDFYGILNFLGRDGEIEGWAGLGSIFIRFLHNSEYLTNVLRKIEEPTLR